MPEHWILRDQGGGRGQALCEATAESQELLLSAENSTVIKAGEALLGHFTSLQQEDL